jgi:hypothetical protein
MLALAALHCPVVGSYPSRKLSKSLWGFRRTGLICTLLATREESVVDSIVLDTDINDIVDSLIESIQAAASWDGKASMCGFDLEIALLGFVSSGYGKGMMLN